MRIAGVRGQTSEERFAEITPGKTYFQPGLTATGEDSVTQSESKEPEWV